jgi:hypothetical protein
MLASASPNSKVPLLRCALEFSDTVMPPLSNTEPHLEMQQIVCCLTSGLSTQFRAVMPRRFSSAKKAQQVVIALPFPTEGFSHSIGMKPQKTYPVRSE